MALERILKKTNKKKTLTLMRDPTLLNHNTKSPVRKVPLLICLFLWIIMSQVSQTWFWMPNKGVSIISLNCWLVSDKGTDPGILSYCLTLQDFVLFWHFDKKESAYLGGWYLWVQIDAEPNKNPDRADLLEIYRAIEFDIGFSLIALKGIVGPWVEVCTLLLL